MKPSRIFLSALFACALFLFAVPLFGNEVATIVGAGTFAMSFIKPSSVALHMNNVAARQVYENSLRALSLAFPGKNVASFRPAQGSLRLELALSTSVTNYQFQVLNQTTGSQFNTEIRLNLQDSFVISSLAVFIGHPSGSTDTTFELDTYCDTVKYTNAAAMNAFYNGQLQIKVNNDVFIPVWDLQRHFYRPQTQTTAAANSPLNQKRLAEDSFYPVEPNIILGGDKNNAISITLPAALSAIDANSRVILMLRGILAQNSTSVG